MRHLSVGHAEPLRSELMAFVKAIRDGIPPAVTGEEGVASLAVAIQCLNGRAAGETHAEPPRLVRANSEPRRARSAFAKT
jgi:predicted dehydrogenase